MFLARVLAFAIGQAMRNDDDESVGGGMIEFLMIIVFQILFGILGAMVTSWFSRFREYRADAGGARYAGRDKMVAALEKLRGTEEMVAHQNEGMAAFKIAGGRPGGLRALLMTHPPLENRIRALQQMKG